MPKQKGLILCVLVLALIALSSSEAGQSREESRRVESLFGETAPKN